MIHYKKKKISKSISDFVRAYDRYLSHDKIKNTMKTDKVILIKNQWTTI